MPKLARLKPVFLLLAGLVCALLIWTAFHFLGPRNLAEVENFGSGKPLDLEKVANYSVEELIDRLQDVAVQGLGTHSTAWAEGFLATDEEPRFRGGVLGSAKPAVSPMMRELVRRGVSGLPGLLDHLEDRRPTCLVIKHFGGGFGGMWHSDEYDCRYADQDKQPPGVNTRREDDLTSVGGYRVRVGDLCFVAIGQIVNRRMHLVRYQPSACIVLNSPVETPSLAEAVRKDWGGLTAEHHEESLIEDSKDSSEYVTAPALVRLRFYYPKAAARMVPKDEMKELP